MLRSFFNRIASLRQFGGFDLPIVHRRAMVARRGRGCFQMHDTVTFRQNRTDGFFRCLKGIVAVAILGGGIGLGPAALANAKDIALAQACNPPKVEGDKNCAAANAVAASRRPPVRVQEELPVARWDHRPGAAGWTSGALSALRGHAAPLVKMVPKDIAQWCPAYSGNDPAGRRAFWVGFLSALAKHESTYRETAVGGGGKWHGLLQILPGTARGYGCTARSGRALRDGAANVACGLRIMAVTVRRDGVIHGRRPWRGVSADWGPMRSAKKRADMARWLKRQDYCRIGQSLRPKLRPSAPKVSLPE